MRTLPTNFRFAYLLLLLATLVFGATSCLNSSDNNDDYLADLQRQFEEAKIADAATIKKYLADNNITDYQELPTGTVVVLDKDAPGTGDLPRLGQSVSVLYTGYFFNGQVFDASYKHDNVPYPFVLGTNNIIQGWNDGFALIRKGGKATLLIPSARAYGLNANGPIPANTPLRFDVEVTDIK